MARLEFIDGTGNPTNDYVEGWPTIWVDIEVGFNARGREPDDVVVPNWKRVRALVDTGANHTIADSTLTAGQKPIRHVSRKDVSTIVVVGDVFEALLSIVDLTGTPHHIEIGSRPAGAVTPFPLILGRDILDKYRLIYDGPNKQFSLEHSE